MLERSERIDLLERELGGAGIASHRDEPLGRYTTLGVGGACDLLIQPADVDEMANAYRILDQLGNRVSSSRGREQLADRR